MRKAELAHNLTKVRARVERAQILAHREEDRIDILPISKYQSVEDIKILAQLGVRDFGENIHQAAIKKIAEISHDDFFCEAVPNINWHMVGQIQSKKARAISKWATYVHSVDREKIAHALGQGTEQALESGERSDKLKIFVQYSLDGDPTRGGASGEQVLAMSEYIEASASLHLEGLMIVPPKDVEVEAAFADANIFREKFLGLFPQAQGFSAGMSNDLEVAIQHGSTCVRVGTAIFGAKTLISDDSSI